ncbi:MAG: ADP-ribosylglycohydrolase family protein [Limisphaerales bacterium]
MHTRFQRPRASSAARHASTPEQRANRLRNALWGTFIADALSMPVHWYYDRGALQRDYGVVSDYMAPRNPHPDSILWRIQYDPPKPECDILHDQRQYWGRRDIHYHQFLVPGENTLNLKLAEELLASVHELGRYDGDDYLARYLAFHRKPGRHNDTYVEECHRHFFDNLALGVPPKKAGTPDSHIGGLVAVPILAVLHHKDRPKARATIREHVGLTHPAPDTLAAADALACLLFALFEGTPMADAAETVAHAAPEARLVPSRLLEWIAEPDDEVVGGRLSNACYIEEALPAALYLALKYSSDFEAGLVANAQVGGDNCHRGAVLGSLLGAASDGDPVPPRWRAGLEARNRLEPLIESLVRAVL